MENASKALLIAGSILIVIVLITIGVAVIQYTGGMTDQVESQSDTFTIQSFNSQFSSYIGGNKSASVVRELIQKINANNVSSEHDIDWGEGSITTINGVVTTERYTIDIQDTDGDGFFDECTIE